MKTSEIKNLIGTEVVYGSKEWPRYGIVVAVGVAGPVRSYTGRLVRPAQETGTEVCIAVIDDHRETTWRAEYMKPVRVLMPRAKMEAAKATERAAREKAETEQAAAAWRRLERRNAHSERIARRGIWGRVASNGSIPADTLEALIAMAERAPR